MGALAELPKLGFNQTATIWRFPWESIDTASGNLILTFIDLALPANSGRALRFQRV